MSNRLDQVLIGCARLTSVFFFEKQLNHYVRIHPAQSEGALSPRAPCLPPAPDPRVAPPRNVCSGSVLTRRRRWRSTRTRGPLDQAPTGGNSRKMMTMAHTTPRTPVLKLAGRVRKPGSGPPDPSRRKQTETRGKSRHVDTLCARPHSPVALTHRTHILKTVCSVWALSDC